MALNLTPSLTTVSDLSGLTATANIGSIGLSWTPGVQKFLRYVEVWRATANNRATASLITTTLSDSYTDVDFTDNTDYYYWIRPKNIFNRNDNWHPTSSTGGVHVLSATTPTVDVVLATTVSSSNAGAISGSGSTTITASTYGSYSGTTTLATFTPPSGSANIYFNMLSLLPTLGAWSGGSDGDSSEIIARIFLYNDTDAVEVPNYNFTFNLGRFNRFGGTWSGGAYTNIVHFPFILQTGFLGPANSTKTYKLKGEIKRNRISGTTGTGSANFTVDFAYSASTLS